MTTIDTVKTAVSHAARLAAANVLGALIVAYFAYFAWYGERGHLALANLQTEVSKAEQALDTIRGERLRIERRASLMRPDHLDADMLDEQARLMLNYSRPDEVFIVAPGRSAATARHP
ncbi:Septum formation initiator [uncultured Gammaproteobacteria bacterium]